MSSPSGPAPLRRTLRFRVPLTALAILTVSLLVGALIAYHLLLQDGQRDIDVVIAREQQRYERAITNLLEDARNDAPEADDRTLLETATRRYYQLNPSTASYWSIVTFEDGRRLAASNGPPELTELFTDRTLPAGELNARETIDTGTDAGEIRTSRIPVVVDGERLATLQVVSPLAPVRSEAREAALLVGAATGTSLLVGGVLLSLALSRALAPLGALVRAARSTELEQLDARVAVPETDDEVAQLAAEFNTMLDRLHAARRQQQEFLASVGHELRTPITIARGHLELLSTVDRDDPTAVAATVAIVRDELGRMGRLVEDLMTIARRGTTDFVRPRALDLVGWFEELELKLAGTDAGRVTRIEPPPPVTFEADPDRLAQAVINLVTNAVVHNPPDTPVNVRAAVSEDAGMVDLHVVDHGDGIDPSIVEEVFSPFVRAGEVRDSSGLGLAVVAAVVDAHGGEIDLDTSSDGTRVTLRLPINPVGPDHPGGSPLE